MGWKPVAGQQFGFSFRVASNNGPTLYFGEQTSATKRSALVFHPYWERKPNTGVQWRLAAL